MVPILEIAGSNLTTEDSDSREAEAQLRFGSGQLTDAWIAQQLFFDYEEQSARRRSAHERNLDATIRKAHAYKLTKDRDIRDPQVWIDLDKQILEYQIRTGRWTTGLLNRIPFLMAYNFVFAINGVRNAIENIGKLGGLGQPAISALERFDINLPNVVPIRHSLAHLDERFIGRVKDRGKKKSVAIKLEPIMNSLIHAPQGVMVVGQIVDDEFQCTVADGRLLSISLSDETLEVGRDCLQSIIDGLEWRGHPQIWP